MIHAKSLTFLTVTVAVMARPQFGRPPPPGSAPGGFGAGQSFIGPDNGGGPPAGSAPGGFGAAQSFIQGPQIPILVDEREGPRADGSYNFNFETGDGISRYEEGRPGVNDTINMSGGWEFTFPDGTPAKFTFVADEFGYRVVSDLLPTPHPLPAHALAQIEFARQQDAAGQAGGNSGGRRF